MASTSTDAPKHCDFHTGADMISSLGSDFFAGGAFFAASSAMVSTYALRRRRRAVAVCRDHARARILGMALPRPLVSEQGLEATTRQRRAAVWMKVFKRAAIGP